MAFHDEFLHTILMPPVDSIHEAIVAFLQTSDCGTWEVDDTVTSNQFVLHFVRGNWTRSFFGLGTRRVPEGIDYYSKLEVKRRTKPMLLEITLRPSPNEIRIRLRHSVFCATSIPRREKECYVEFWKTVVRQEVDSLRHYLEQCFHLDDTPRLEES